MASSSFLSILTISCLSLLQAQEVKKDLIRPLPRTRIIQSHPQRSEELDRLHRLLEQPYIAATLAQLSTRGLVPDLKAFLVSDSQGGQAYALLLTSRPGAPVDKLLSKDERPIRFLAISDSGLALTVEAVIDTVSSQPRRLTLREETTGEGLEVNDLDGNIYALSADGGSTAHTTASGTMGCIKAALGAIISPCSAAFLATTFSACAYGIEAAPETDGASALLSIAACTGFVSQLVQAMLCSTGGNCGVYIGSPDFSLAASPPSRVITAGQTATYTITGTFIGGNSSVSGFFISNLFAGASYSFQPQAIDSSNPTTTLTITTNTNTEQGDRILTVGGTSSLGTGSGTTRTTVVELNINAPTGGSGGGGGPLSNGQSVGGTLTQGQQNNYSIMVPTGSSQLLVNMTGTGDADLYVKYGSTPTLNSYDCRPYTSTANETCSVSNPAVGNWYIMINGYSSSSSYTLTASYSGGGGGNSAPAPHISDINPKLVSVGLENAFTVTGTGFQQGFRGTLWVGGSSFPIDPSKTSFSGPSQVTLIPRVGAAGDPTTAFGLQVTNPDNQASNIFTGLTAQASSGGSGSTTAGLQVSFSPNPTPLVNVSDCSGTSGRGYLFTLVVTETQGVGVTPTGLNIDGGTNWMPNNYSQRIAGRGNNSFSLEWCRAAGSSTWTVTGRDDNGHTVTGTATLVMN
jgi:hypothetical protein